MQPQYTDLLHVQVQRNSEQLEQQQHLNKHFAEQQQKIEEQLQEQRNLTDTQLVEQQKIVDENKSIILEHDERLKKLEEQLQRVTRKKVLWKRPNLAHITRTRHLCPDSKMLYNTTVTLRRSNRRLKRLTKLQKQQFTKQTSMHTKLSNNVEKQFVDMIIRNSEVHPQVNNIPS